MEKQFSAIRRALMMQLLIWIGRLTLRLCLAGLVLAGSGLPAAGVDLGGGFRNPPDSARPWVYWFWLDGNITKEGITADLEAMQRVGLGGALWMWGGGVGEGVKGPVKFLSPEWWNSCGIPSGRRIGWA
jgi:hypothetical protein